MEIISPIITDTLVLDIQLPIIESKVIDTPTADLESIDEEQTQIEEDLGLESTIILFGLNNNEPIKCKIDTGAGCCSLQASNIEQNDSTVSFDLFGHRYTSNISTMQNIQTADNGTEQRPAININCKFNDEQHEQVLFNLNDREGLVPCLIGMNLLSKLNTKIDLSA